MERREFLMLAMDYDPAKHAIAGSWVSEKLDGIRAFWDGGQTRGMRKSEVPWANTAKDERYLVEPISTGLWSRYGNVIHAPNWWLDKLPQFPLDGELYTQRRDRQNLSSIVKKLDPDDNWQRVKFCVFDIPSVNFLNDGRINNPHYIKRIEELHKFLDISKFHNNPLFDTIVRRIRNCSNDVIEPVTQVQLSFKSTEAQEQLAGMLDVVTNVGGEGLIVRASASIWFPKRVNSVLKVKRLKDDEGTVIGYRSGSGKLLGMLGSLKVAWKGQEFYLSGFSDVERALISQTGDHERWLTFNENTDLPHWISSPFFPIGSLVRFRYRDVTRDGLPVEARFWR